MLFSFLTLATRQTKNHSHLLCFLEPQAGHCREPGSPLPLSLHCAELEFCCAKVPADHMVKIPWAQEGNWDQIH